MVAEALLGQVGHHLADKSDGGLLFHSGGVAWGGGGLMLPGGIGAGKSTLTAWFLNQGCTYLTDEMVFVPEGAAEFHGFTRPVTIKDPARSVVQALLPVDRVIDVWRTPGIDLIPAVYLGASGVMAQAPIRSILFPRFQSGATLEWYPLTKAQTGLRLMECLVNARNLPDHGFAQVARLAQMAPAYSLTYGGFDQLPQLLDQVQAALSPK